MKVLTNRNTELKKLHEVIIHVAKITGIWQWNRALWIQQKNLKK
jgi:hypothetical protein